MTLKTYYQIIIIIIIILLLLLLLHDCVKSDVSMSVNIEEGSSHLREWCEQVRWTG